MFGQVNTPHGGGGRRPRRSHPPPLRRRDPDGPHGLRGVHLLGRAAVYAAHVRAAVSSLVCPVAALVLDLFWSPLVVVARELGVPAYCTSTATPRRSPNSCACRRCARRWPASSGRWTARRTFAGCPQCRRSSSRRRSWNWKGRSPNAGRFMGADGIIANTAEAGRPLRHRRGPVHAQDRVPYSDVVPDRLGHLVPHAGRPATRVRAVAGDTVSRVRGLPLLRERRVRVGN